MKKILAILMSLLLVLSLCAVAFAEGKATIPPGTDPEKITNEAIHEDGTITINGVSTSNTYAIYKILHLESYNKESGAYSYKISKGWEGFFVNNPDSQVKDALDYVSVDATGYVTWGATEDDDTKAAFAKLALAYAKANNLVPVRSSVNDGDFVITDESGVFSGLTLGYYLVDSTVGALCGLTTTNPDASINAKNGIPTIDKQVNEDSTAQWGGSNTADIGQDVEFRVTINVHPGAENYVLHDVMSKGFTFKEVTKIEHIQPSASGETTHTTPAEKYTIKTAPGITDTTEDDITGTCSGTEACTFEVHFTKQFCDDLEQNDKVVIYYKAMLNRDAVINGEGNRNTAWLSFGEGNKTEPDYTVTKTFNFDIVKTDSQNNLINGARFKVYDAPTGGNEIAVVALHTDSDGTVKDYRRARADETGEEILVKNGLMTVNGFDNGTYYLEETMAPHGYNKLTTRQKFIISDGNLTAVFNTGTDGKEIYSTGSGVHVVNKTGTMLPETGGLGTLIFTAVGVTLVLITGVVLVTKKRMSKIVD